MVKFIQELRDEPILLAHHPLCGKFDDHMLSIRGRKVCRGCITVYPMAALVLTALLLLRPAFELAFVLSLAFFCLQLPRFFVRNNKTSIAFNIMLGGSLASVLYSAIVCPDELRVFIYPFIAFVIVTFEYLKGKRMMDKCHDCPEHHHFPKCARGREDHTNGK